MEEYNDSIQYNDMVMSDQSIDISNAPDNINALITWGMIVIGIILTAIIIVIYLRKYKSKQLLNYVPTVWTSLGILGTFVTIVLRLDGVNDLNDVDVLVRNLVPAFWTSIIGISGALISSVIIKYIYARDEKDELCELAKASGIESRHDGLSLSPELALLKIEKHLTQGNNALKLLYDEIRNIRKENSETIERNLQQLESIYDRIFEENKNQAENLTKQYIDGVNQLIMTTNDKIKDSTVQIVSEHILSINRFFDSELNKLDELSNRIKTIVAEIPNEFENTRSGLIDTIQQAIVDKYQIIIEANSALANELLERVRQFELSLSDQSKSDYSSLIGELSNQISTNVSVLEDSLHNQEIAFRDAAREINESMVSTSRSLQKSQDDYNSLIVELGKLLEQLSIFTAQTEQLLANGNNTSQQMSELLSAVEQILTKNHQLRYELMQWKRVHKKVVINDKNGTKICPNCGNENLMEANFCKKCAYGFWDCETIGSQLSKSK